MNHAEINRISKPGLEPQNDSVTRGGVPFPSARQLIALLAAYFCIQTIVRVLLSSSVDLDESEQVLFAQKLALGYGPSPPLYTWLQVAFFSALGQSVLGLAALKNLLLFATYTLTYINGRLITGRHEGGVAAAISLLFIPQMVWEAQRDLTHTVLASTFAVASLSCFVPLQRTRLTRWYVALGAIAGMGLLSKFNFGLWLLGLFGAALSIREFRSAVLDRRMLLTLAVALGAVLPYALWAIGHASTAFNSLSKLKIEQSSAWLDIVRSGVWNLAIAAVSFVGPLAAVHAIVFLRAPSRTGPAQGMPYAKLILRAVLIIGAIVFLAVLVFRSSGSRNRWFQPLLVNLATLAAALVSDRLDRTRLKQLTTTGLAVMAVVLLLIPGRIVYGQRFGREEPLMRPYAALAAQLKASLPPGSYIVAEPVLLGGNLQLALQDVTVMTPDTTHLFANPGRQCVLVWDDLRGPRSLERLKEWVKTRLSMDLPHVEPTYFTAPYQYSPAKQARLAMVQLN